MRMELNLTESDLLKLLADEWDEAGHRGDDEEQSEHGRRLIGVETHERVLLLEHEERDPGDEPEEVGEQARQVRIETQARFLRRRRRGRRGR